MRSLLRVVTPPSSSMLTTLDAVRDELGNYDPLSAARMQRLIREASGLVSAFMDCRLAKARYEETFGSPTLCVQAGWRHTSPLTLSVLPVVQIVAVVSGGVTHDASLVTVGADGQLAGWWGRGATVVTYDAGYVVPGQASLSVSSTLPADIERACIDTVVALWHRAGRGDPMIRSESVEGVGSTSYLDPASGPAAALPPTAVAALASYRSINV